MIEVIALEDDDPQFVEVIQNTVCGAGDFYKPAAVYVTHIAGWFDHKWLGFSGKVMGALGVWKTPLTLPPFHPHRVLSQNLYLFDPVGEAYLKANERGIHLHRHQASSHNLRREIGRRRQSVVYVWYSGNTQRLDKGSLMVYVHTARDRTAWFAGYRHAGYRHQDGWQAYQARDISLQLVVDLEAAGRVAI